MRISEKTIRREGRTLPVVELIPARVEKTLRWMCGAAGLVFVALAVAMTLFVPEITERYQLKVIILGAMLGGTFVLAAVGRKIYRSVDSASIRSGTRWLGLTHWSPRIPTTKSQVLDIGRNDDAALFVTVRRPEGETLLSIGPFVDGDQAVKASSLLSPAQHPEGGALSPVDAVRVLRQLEGGPPPAVSRILTLLIFCGLLIPVWFDRSWLDAGLSLLIGVPLLILAITWFTPRGGVFHNTDDSKSVEFWTRHRFFRRLEYRKSLVTNESPEFLKQKLHFASLGWVLLIPIYVAAVIALLLR